MNLFDAKQLAVSLMKEFKLFGWKFGFDDGKRRFGVCNYRKSEIRLSRHLTLLNGRAEVEDTIRHEIAHALTPGAGHGRAWRVKAVACGARPQRCYSSAKVVQPPRPFVGTCPACGTEVRRFCRKKIACAKCCRGRFDPQFLFQWRRVS